MIIWGMVIDFDIWVKFERFSRINHLRDEEENVVQILETSTRTFLINSTGKVYSFYQNIDTKGIVNLKIKGDSRELGKVERFEYLKNSFNIRYFKVRVIYK